MSPENPSNIDTLTVQGFGEEWPAFDQSDVPEAEARGHFDAYFAPFGWDLVGPAATGFDMGCGSCAKLLAPRVGHLHCSDPSTALEIARRNLVRLTNVSFHQAGVDAVPLPPVGMNFAMSLGALHHIPDTAAAIKSCAEFLKPGAQLLLYLYYRFDSQPGWYRLLWDASEPGRRIIFRLPQGPRIVVTSLIAALIYWPLARLAGLLAALGLNIKYLPLSNYCNGSFYTMRPDALGHFGTRLEQCFTRAEISAMATTAGCANIRFSDKAPYWCVCAARNG